MTTIQHPIKYHDYSLSNSEHLELFEALLLPRMIEEKMLILLRQGKISKWFSGIGQEAISVGAAMAMNTSEFILPMHRNLGVFTARNIPLDRLFAQFQGKKEGFTKGRDRSFHFGTLEHHIVGMISHLGPQMALADGIALANLLDGKEKSTLVFSGDGASSEGDFHEALNVAAVWQLPVIFLIENNGYGLSTPSEEQFRFKNFIDKGPGYGMRAVKIDGNNILEVYDTIRKLNEEIRENPEPVLVEAITFRMRGHEEASGTKYVPQELFDEWAKKDPVVNYQNYLIEEGILNEQMLMTIRKRNTYKIETGLKKAYGYEPVRSNIMEELNDIYASVEPPEDKDTGFEAKEEIRYVDAISEGLNQAMQIHPDLILMGQDIAEYGGVFKITEGFVENYGKERVRNTPLCESAIIGVALGLSIAGKKSMVEMQFADFVSCGFNQIVNNLAKIHYRWGQSADVVIRMPTGAGVGAGPFHSQSNEAWFFHTPGLKIVYPSNPIDAKGLLLSAINDPNPVLYFEHKKLYRSSRAEVSKSSYYTPIGKARIERVGSDLSIITYGMGVHWALAAAEELKEHSIEIIDLRTLLPWDKEAVENSIKKTNRVLILHEDCQTGGIGGEIAAWIAEHCFEHLDAPVARLGSLDTPVPFAAALEADFLASARVNEAITKLLNY
ncbi:MAG: dehydrogenase E1 component subunit alpha/beta [Cyclobacteriaceae bacterium]|nr:dehydrogenase E1 component subunit alpha/beta [Cyclobacteriaceae bacterium]MCH8516601.1 dehydrogenase E1 component subunit alpha/beta [Cyclobacteriaceae bacterium]